MPVMRILRSEDPHKGGPRKTPGEDGGGSKFRGFRDAAARALAGRKQRFARTTATHGSRGSLRDRAAHSRLPASCGGTNMMAGNPNRQTSGGVWREMPPGSDP